MVRAIGTNPLAVENESEESDAALRGEEKEMEWVYLTSRIDPFNVTANPSSGDQATFFGAVGRCITAWTFIENNLLHVYSVALSAMQSDSIAASFYSVPTFNTRLALADSAVVYGPATSQLKAQWRDLFRRLSEGAVTRNKVAHGTTYFDPDRAQSEQLFLAHGFANPKKLIQEITKAKGLTALALMDAAEAARLLSSEVFSFGNNLATELQPGRVETAKYIVELDAKGMVP